MQDLQILFNIIVGVSGAMGGYILTSIARSIDRVDNEVRTIPKDYVHKDDFHRSISELRDSMKNGFDQIERNFGAVFRKLDDKEDKSPVISARREDRS